MINVTVITAVGDTEVTLSTTDGRINAQVQADPAVLKSVFVTQFNLLEGDIIATAPKALDELDKVAELHSSNVEKAVSVLPSNIQALVNTAKEIIALIERDPKPPTS